MSNGYTSKLTPKGVRYGYVYVPKPRDEGGYYSDKQKIEAISNYLVTGNVALTCRLLGIKECTFRSWQRKPWWNEMVNSILVAKKSETKTKLAKISEKAMEAVLDRLEGGNYQYDQKTGQVIRVPVNARDASRIVGEALDREALLEARIKQLELGEEQKKENVLADIAAQFSNISKQLGTLSKERDIIDVTPSDAEYPVDDQREDDHG